MNNGLVNNVRNKERLLASDLFIRLTCTAIQARSISSALLRDSAPIREGTTFKLTASEQNFRHFLQIRTQHQTALSYSSELSNRLKKEQHSHKTTSWGWFHFVRTWVPCHMYWGVFKLCLLVREMSAVLCLYFCHCWQFLHMNKVVSLILDAGTVT